KEFAAAEAEFERVLAGADNPAFRAVVLTNRSTLRIQQGRWEDAERDLLRAIELQPKAYQGHLALAQAYQARGDREAAVNALGRAIALRPGDGGLYYTRAQWQALRGDPAAARQDFEQVLALEPAGSKSERLASARVELAHLRHQDHGYQAALADCDAALAA